MAPVVGVVQSGTYIVQNVASKNYVILKDGNRGSPVTSGNNAQDENAKWTITKLNNNKYTIMAYVHATFAKVGANPTEGDPIVGRADDYQWSIKETNRQGHYVITPSADDFLHWSAPNSNVNTDVKLHSDANDKAVWQFTRVTA